MKVCFKNKLLALALTSILIMSGCSSTEDKEGSLTDENTAGAGSGASTAGTGDSSGFGGSDVSGSGTNGYGDDGMGGSGSAGANGNKVIYFMYDSSQVMEEFIPVIAGFARNLKSNPSQHLILEGHADERGSREYNIALGEQRAKAVARMMTMQGARDSQIEVVSYGEEKGIK